MNKTRRPDGHSPAMVKLGDKGGPGKRLVLVID